MTGCGPWLVTAGATTTRKGREYMDVDRGYFIVNGEIVEVEGYDESIRRSRKTVLSTGEDNKDYLASQVFWTREGAQAVLDTGLAQ